MQSFALAAAIGLNACAHLLIKAASRSVPPEGMFSLVFLARPTLLAGAACFALSLAAYTYSLTTLAVSVAYPLLMAVALLLVALGGIYFFGERLSWPQWLGALLVIGGAFLLMGRFSPVPQ